MRLRQRFGRAAASTAWEYAAAAPGERFTVRAAPSPPESSAQPLSAGASRIARSAASQFLPKGFPSSVGPDYLRYSAWTATHMAIGSAAGVLSTQSLLLAVGVGQATAAPLAASLNWVLKDGLGQLAAVGAAAAISDRFDADPKRWRVFAVRGPRPPHPAQGPPE